jgi:Dyp-type peroxidase family
VSIQAPGPAAAAGAGGGPVLETGDIQGLVAAGYGRLRLARYLLYKVTAPAPARTWLAHLAAAVTNASAPVTVSGLNLAFTFAGLARLGLDPGCLAGFPMEFVEGMVTPHRSRMLGDTGASAPAGWRWGGDAADPVEILLMLFALDEPALEALQQSTAGDPSAAGLREVARLETYDLGDHEHFGFHDGISQPVVEGFGRPAPWRDSIKPGEFVLGYPNEYGLTAPPIPGTGTADFGRNGSFLVFRQLKQDVAALWTFAEQHASEGGAGTAEGLAAKMVGRWPSGAPLVRAPNQDDPTLASLNDFAYGAEDPAGLRCPIGSHVRRTNPRDSLDPSPGTDKSVELTKRHRILRRGREYGPPIASSPAGPRPPLVDDGRERGLHFICLNADLVRQFEFVQATWVASPKFAGLYDDADPVIAARGPAGSSFTVPGRPFRHRHRQVPEFVTVVGGGYFFLPGISALRHLASAGGASDQG